MILDGQFSADIIVVDGYDFNKISEDEFSSFKKFAEEQGIEIWFSATMHRDGLTLENGTPEFLHRFSKDIAILIMLEPKENLVHLKLVKDHEISPADDLHLKLDPQILLIAEET